MAELCHIVRHVTRIFSPLEALGGLEICSQLNHKTVMALRVIVRIWLHDLTPYGIWHTLAGLSVRIDDCLTTPEHPGLKRPVVHTYEEVSAVTRGKSIAHHFSDTDVTRDLDQLTRALYQDSRRRHPYEA